MAICLSDPNQPDNPLVYVNKAFCLLTGYDEQEILGRNCRFLQGEETDRATAAQIATAIGRRNDINVELYNYRKDGTGFWNSIHISPVFDDEGRLIYFFGSQLDVTERRNTEMLIQQSQRMEALGTMAVGVAHEFNNLLTIVRGSLEQAMVQPGTERQKTQLSRADWAVTRIARLTQQMLSFSRREFHQKTPTNLRDLVENIDDLIRQSAGPGIDLDLNLSSIIAYVDASQLELAILNLVRNATDAMGGQGKLLIEIVAAGLIEGKSFAALSVTDTGPGMAPETLRRATEPFFTTKEYGKGTGLGLSMVHGFSEQSGGRLEIRSAPGKGTRVTILLPEYSP